MPFVFRALLSFWQRFSSYFKRKPKQVTTIPVVEKPTEAENYISFIKHIEKQTKNFANFSLIRQSPVFGDLSGTETYSLLYGEGVNQFWFVYDTLDKCYYLSFFLDAEQTFISKVTTVTLENFEVVEILAPFLLRTDGSLSFKNDYDFEILYKNYVKTKTYTYKTETTKKKSMLN
jgi:hypothetical protein